MQSNTTTMKPVTMQDLIDLVKIYMEDKGIMDDWKEFIEEKGFTLEEIGMKED